MDLPVRPPIAPMLARLERRLPAGGGWLYEPKWDGFRCVVFRAGDAIELRSRHDRPLGRYFPELVEAIAGVETERFTLDGEILVAAGGAPSFAALMARIHPATRRVEALSRSTPAELIAFDLLAIDGEDLRTSPFETRRSRLAAMLAGAPEPIRPTPITERPERAMTWLACSGAGAIDGVVAKRRDLRYEVGARAMVKVKRERTMDCVVGGFRWLVDRPLPAAVLLGLWDGDALRHIGVVSQLSEARRQQILERLTDLVTSLEGHPWEHGFLVGGGHAGRLPGAAGSWRPGEMELDWVPVVPALVCEVAYEHVDAGRLRHPARFRRWRDDRDPRSCTFDQLPARSDEGSG